MPSSDPLALSHHPSPACLEAGAPQRPLSSFQDPEDTGSVPSLSYDFPALRSTGGRTPSSPGTCFRKWLPFPGREADLAQVSEKPKPQAYPSLPSGSQLGMRLGAQNPQRFCTAVGLEDVFMCTSAWLDPGDSRVNVSATGKQRGGGSLSLVAASFFSSQQLLQRALVSRATDPRVPSGWAVGWLLLTEAQGAVPLTLPSLTRSWPRRLLGWGGHLP